MDQSQYEMKSDLKKPFVGITILEFFPPDSEEVLFSHQVDVCIRDFQYEVTVPVYSLGEGVVGAELLPKTICVPVPAWRLAQLPVVRFCWPRAILSRVVCWDKCPQSPAFYAGNLAVPSPLQPSVYLDLLFMKGRGGVRKHPSK